MRYWFSRAVNIVLVSALGACGSMRDANAGNFENALRAWYASQNTQLCVVAGGPETLAVAMSLNGPGEESYLPRYELSDSQEVAKEEALVAVGLLLRSVSQEITPAPPPTFLSPLEPPGYTTTYNTYQLTPDGSR